MITLIYIWINILINKEEGTTIIFSSESIKKLLAYRVHTYVTATLDFFLINVIFMYIWAT